MVVMLHSYVAVQGFHISQVDYEQLSGTDIYSLVGITLSHVLTQVAVPVFFFISGYLFYIGFQKWNWQKYVEKIKRRIKTLVVPYLLWNTIQALITIGIMVLAYYLLEKPLGRICTWFEEVGGLYGIYWNDQTTAVVKENMFGLETLKSYPLLIPMWFIRDLMITVLFSPVLWWLLKKIPMVVLSVLALLWALGVGIPVPGLSFSGLLFFGLGGAFSLYEKSFLDMFSLINKWLLIMLFVILTVASIAYDGRSTDAGQILLSLWILVALPFFFRLAAWCMGLFPKIVNIINSLSGVTYFVFAFHGVIISYIYTALWKMFGVVTDGGLLDAGYMDSHALNGIATYLLTPVLAVAISVLGYWLVCKTLKSKSWYLTGK